MAESMVNGRATGPTSLGPPLHPTLHRDGYLVEEHLVLIRSSPDPNRFWSRSSVENRNRAIVLTKRLWAFNIPNSWGSSELNERRCIRCEIGSVAR